MKWYCMKDENTYIFSPVPFYTILALMALFCLWLLARAYTIEQGRKYEKLSTEDIALLKIIKDNATRIWNHQHHGKKVIRLKDCKE